MDIFVGVVVGLVVLMLLVVAHEFGHFLMSRRNGVRVLEFGIGFPPRAIAWIKDPKTHKWRKLKKSEWETVSITKTVGIEKNKSTTSDTDDKKLIQDGLIFVRWMENRQKIPDRGLLVRRIFGRKPRYYLVG